MAKRPKMGPWRATLTALLTLDARVKHLEDQVLGLQLELSLEIQARKLGDAGL